MSYPAKGRADYLELGDWNAVCYQCGRKRKASTLIRHWQGYYVCPEHWEVRHPQDFVKGIKDIQTPPWVQPMPGSSSGFNFGSNLVPSYNNWVNGSTTTDTFALTGTIIPGNGTTIPDQYIPAYPTPGTVTGLSGSVTVLNGGSGYTAGDVLTLSGGTLATGGVGTTVTVSTVVNGTITGATVNSGGSYATTPVCTPVVVTVSNTLDPASHSSHITLSNGNLTSTTDGTAVYQNAAGFYASSGKRYFEVTYVGNVGVNSGRRVGIGTSATTIADGTVIGGDATGYAYDHQTGGVFNNNTSTAYGATWDGGDVIGVLWDAGAGTLGFSKNGVLQGTAYTGITGTFRPVISGFGTILGTTGANFTVNFGSTAFSSLPAGYSAWGSSASSGCGVSATGGTGTGAILTVPATTTTLSYSTLNPTYASISGISLSNGNLIAVSTQQGWQTTWTTIPGTIYKTVSASSSEVLYAEFTYSGSTDFLVGLTTAATMAGGLVSTYLGQLSGSYGYSVTNLKWSAGSSAAAGLGMGVPTTIGLLFTLATGTMQVRAGSGAFVTMFTGLTGSYAAAITLPIDGNTVANFGQNAWTNNPPAGASGWLG